MNVTILRNETTLKTVSNIPNTGSYKLKRPNTLGNGGGYTYAIKPKTSMKSAVLSHHFVVKGKIPFIIPIGIPVLLTGGVATWILLPDEPDPSPIDDPSSTKINDPISPPSTARQL